MDTKLYCETIRGSMRGDEAALKHIWKTVFGDSDEIIGAFFASLYAPGAAVVAVKDGEIISAGYCLSGAEAGEFRCSYIYAMATLPEHRSHNLAHLVGRALIGRALADGADVVATLPADGGLTKWYETSLGMAPAFRKGGEGVTFPESWRTFAQVCGEHDDSTPGQLWCVTRPGLKPEQFAEIGWELTFD